MTPPEDPNNQPPDSDFNVYSPGVNCSTFGDTAYCSDGSTYTQFGDTVGDTWTQFGDTVYGPDGDTWTQFGDTVYGPGGSTCTEFGRTVYCSP